MLKLRLHKKRPGNTLLESLLYIAIFSIVITVIMYFAIVSSSQRARGSVTNEVDYAGNAIVDLLTQTIRNSAAVNSPGAGISSSTLSLNTPTGSLNPTVFSTQLVSGITRLQIAEGSPAVNNYLTNSHIDITSLSFTNAKVSGSNDSILIRVTLAYHNPNSQAEFKYQKTFYGAATRR